MMHATCRSDRVAVEDTYQYNDSVANDTFKREPYCVKFSLRDAGAPVSKFSVNCIILGAALSPPASTVGSRVIHVTVC